jgi:thioredoxin reductase (NADPH)
MGEKTYDVIILGTGPAGLQAAIHAARKKVSVLVMGRDHKSSAYGAHIENYCCMDGIRGDELLRRGRSQAEDSGTEFLNEDAVELNREDGWFIVKAEGGIEFRCRSSVLAMGISRKKLRVPGEKEFLGRGVGYCVDCDANFFKGMVVAVAGCGSAAVSGAMTLLFYASDVYLICERLEVSEDLAGQVRRGAIHLYEGRSVKEISGKEAVQSILLDDGSRLEVSGIFIELGAKGAVELVGGLGIELDSEAMQYIVTNKNQETNIPGLYAAGDICGPPWQVAKAVGEGCVAGIEAAGFAKRVPRKA